MVNGLMVKSINRIFTKLDRGARRSRTRGATTLASVREQMRVSAEKYKTKPGKAVLSVLDLHADEAGTCLGCRESYPCQTVEVVAEAFNLSGSLGETGVQVLPPLSGGNPVAGVRTLSRAER